MVKRPFLKIITDKLKNIVNSDKVMKNIAMVSGGTALGQVINTMFSPIITRVYTPEEYGLLSVFSSILLIFSFSSLKYEMAIPIAKDEDEAVNTMALSIIVLLFVSFLVSIALFVRGDFVLDLLNAESLEAFIIFIPLGILFQGIYLILKHWMFRIKNFKIVSKTKVMQTFIGNMTKVILGILNFGGAGLVIGRILSVSAGSLSFYKKFKNRNKKEVSVTIKKITYNAKKYKDFPMFQATSTGVVHFRNQFPVLFLAPLYGPEIVGLYGLANTIVKIPMILIGQSVMDVFFAEIASIGKSDPDKIKKLSADLFKKLVIIGIIPISVLIIAGPFLFSFIFGNEWVEAGIYARLLSIYIFSNLIFSPVSKIFEVFRKQSIKFGLDFFSLILISIVFLVAHFLEFEARSTVLLYSLTMAFVYFITYVVAQRILNKESERIKGE